MAGVLIVNKPIYLLPFIIAYKLVYFVISLPFKFVKYFSIGFFAINYVIISYFIDFIYMFIKYTIYGLIFISMTCYRILRLIVMAIYQFIKYFIMGLMTTVIVIINLIIGIFKNSTKILKGIINTIKMFFRCILLGFVFTSFIVYKLIKYVLMSLVFPFVPFIDLIVKANSKYKVYTNTKKEHEERKFEARREEYVRRHAERLKKEDELKAHRADIIAERKKRKAQDNEAYYNEKVVIEKKKISDYINDFLMVFVNVPSKFYQKLVKKYNNLSVVKNMRNKKDMERESLLMSFAGEEAERSDIKLLYEYVAKNPEGKVIKGYFDAFSKVEVHSFLLSEGFEVYSIKTSAWIRFIHGNAGSNKVKIKTKDLIFFITQLSTYIKAGIPLVEALKILTRQFKNKGYQRIFRSLIYDLTMGETFSDALTKQGTAFPRLLVNMVKASEMTGQLPEVLDDMADYFTEVDKTRKQMVTAMMYPVIIMFVAVVVITFILIYVIPRFVDIYSSMDSSQIPAFTQMIISASAFLKNYLLYIILGIVAFVFAFRYLFINVKLFKTMVQWIVMHIPVFGNVVIYNEVTMFTKTFSSLLAHNVFITDSMEILNKITNNEIYKMLILDTITNLAKGEKISEAFKDHWAFPVPAYEMIVTGEKTGELPEMMAKVSSYYQELHANSVTRIKTFMEPVLIIFLTVVVGGIVLAIIIPMFNMYSAIQA